MSSNVPTISAYYAFSREAISQRVSDSYAEYAEAELLNALYQIGIPLGGWTALQATAPVAGCYGDLIDASFSPSAPAVQTLSSWMLSQRHGVDSSRVDAGIVRGLESGEPLRCIVFLVGIVGPTTPVLLAVDEQLRGATVGYLGVFTFGSGTLWAVAEGLSLIPELEIKGHWASGWAITDELLLRILLSAL